MGVKTALLRHVARPEFGHAEGCSIERVERPIGQARRAAMDVGAPIMGGQEHAAVGKQIEILNAADLRRDTATRVRGIASVERRGRRERPIGESRHDENEGGSGARAKPDPAHASSGVAYRQRSKNGAQRSDTFATMAGSRRKLFLEKRSTVAR